MVAQLNPVTREIRGVPPGFGLTDDQVSSFFYEINDEMLAAWDLNKTQFFLSTDISRLPRELREFAERFRINQIIAARMMSQGVPIGYVVVGNKTDGTAFTESDARLLSILAEQVAIAVENGRLYLEQQTNLENAQRLYAVSTELLSRLDPAETPNRVVASVAEPPFTPTFPHAFPAAAMPAGHAQSRDLSTPTIETRPYQS